MAHESLANLRSVPGKTLHHAARSHSPSSFQEQFPASLWLLRPVESVELTSPVFRTGGSESSEVPAGGGARLRDRLSFDPAGVVLHPLIKVGANPWDENVMIGRANNNDVVLRFESVSKLHAYVRAVNDEWRIFDTQSANGTWVEGQRLDPSDENGAVIRSGSEIRFGNVRCEVIENVELYELMRTAK